ncbi:MAG TPA: MFS transporter [Streptosporangiaceae bacterium]|jgi:EmrB/QacA subfamily drug resistance transporter
MRRRWWILVAVSLATFMTYLDNNVTNVAIPTIQRDLHLSIAGLEWVVSSYILVFASLLLFGGRMADIFGRRRLFLGGLTIFTLASLFAGLAGSGGVLIAARVVQGLGAALLVPTTLAIIMATFDNVRERTAAIGTWTAIGAMGLAFGPLIGGFISQHFHWGWIFFINVPIGVITFAIALATMNESRESSATRRLDAPGLVTSAIAMFALTYGLIEGHDRGWTSALIMAAFGVAAVATAAFLLVESRTDQPMVAIRLFRSRIFGGGSAVMMLWAFGILGIYFFTSIYLQTILGFSPTRAGLAFVPMALCMAVFATMSPRLAPLIGSHRAVALGMAAMAGGLYLFAGLGGAATFGSLMPGFLIFGAGAGLMNVPLTNSILHSMPPERAGVASALLNASRELAGLLGITVIGAVLRARQGDALHAGASARGAFLTGYHDGLLVTVVLLAVGAIVGYLALARSGADHAAPDVEATVAAELAPAEAGDRELSGARADR